MHSMADSAISQRDQKRWESSQRITECAQALTVDRGLDGFTMDDLAEAAGVSRRTLFNYFRSKTDAILGVAPDVPDAAVEAFRSGGPHGDLIDDLIELVRIAVAVMPPSGATHVPRSASHSRIRPSGSAKTGPTRQPAAASSAASAPGACL